MLSKRYQKLLVFLAILSIITTGFIGYFPISIYAIVVLSVFLICAIVFRERITKHTWVVVFFIYTIVNLFVTGVYLDASAVGWFLPFWVTFFCFLILFSVVSPQLYFDIYMKAAGMISILAILQVLLAFSQIDFLYDYSWLGIKSRPSYIGGGVIRATAIFSEPAHLGFFLFLPVFSVVSKNKVLRNPHIMLAFILTFSAGSYLSLGLIFLYTIFLARKFSVIKIFTLTVMIIIIAFLMMSNQEIQSKVSSLFVSEDELLLGKNRSAFAFYSMIEVNIAALLDNPWFGFGFGSSESMFKNYFYELYNISEYRFGYPDENFVMKIIGHTGIIGSCIFLMILVGDSKVKKDKIFIVFFLIISLKSGSFYNPILFSFLSLYIVSGINDGVKLSKLIENSRL